MINLEILFFGQFREITGTNKTATAVDDNSKLDNLVQHLSGQYGEEFGELIDNIKGLRILINGREYYLLGRMEAPLSDGDTIVFLPPIAGG
ncbi:MAG: MoaD family protein [Dehalococcoidales bacterium]|nr:MoaD family protein [Dehalococcoidales bacterium]